MMAARKNGNHVIDYRTPLFSIRAVRSAIISDGATYSKYNPLTPDQKDKTPFGIIATIKSVSKSAVERNKVRTRFKEAVRLALTRAPAETEGGKEVANSGTSSMKQVDLPSGYHYLATLSPGIYAEPMTSLVHQVRSAIIALSDQAHSIGKSIQHKHGKEPGIQRPFVAHRGGTPTPAYGSPFRGQRFQAGNLEVIYGYTIMMYNDPCQASMSPMQYPAKLRAIL
ncbi:hypothetical protein QFC20_004649 [Naganishia adeliensis]|uniref:Uncharacterized protein n=1 Tax=Naganishia adeliensis TaxID=92952 RepID=A0ACC2W0A5_9TREE|nr:hypothetical protein QFC20_004649 [Naganishia adeliensis]